MTRAISFVREKILSVVIHPSVVTDKTCDETKGRANTRQTDAAISFAFLCARTITATQKPTVYAQSNREGPTRHTQQNNALTTPAKRHHFFTI
ncbi:hypothetical protein HJC23_002380 [Cyclotella cryptica]|uniref:Uncharacterized protein n=1 Tax=Cyclotella cryptica TaxID=29204 RepID=A0ABD3QL08_9STRA